MEWTKCMFCQNDKSEKITAPTESNKQGVSRNTFQHVLKTNVLRNRVP